MFSVIRDGTNWVHKSIFHELNKKFVKNMFYYKSMLYS